MESLIDTRLTALETALSTLVDSISSYNPSIPAAHAILRADADLQDDLRQLAHHQRNNQRIRSLQETIAQQNDTITSHLTRLVDARKELLSIPTSLPQRDRREVSHQDVLAYAKRIATFTMPPGMRQVAVVKGEGKEEAEPEQPSEGKGMESLEDFEKQWLDPWTGVQFTPWPGEEIIKRGALGEIQAMVERGVDPATAGIGEAEGEKDEEMETSMGDAKEGSGQAQMLRAQKKEEEPRVFGGLDLYDPDEEG